MLWKVATVSYPMNEPTAADKPRYMQLLRELAEAYRAFEAHSVPHIKSWGLTPAQFDVIATLGNTDGLTFGELGARTLIYKTTLTSVVDRLEARGLVARRPSQRDRRSVIAALTPDGAALFEQVFPEHCERLRQCLERMEPEDMDVAIRALHQVRHAFADTEARRD